MAISVIIPSYKNPDYLDLCLKSAFENQVNENQIIVVLDGHVELSEHVVSKYKGLCVVPFEENRGQTAAHNTGVILADNEQILIVNDDNVFGKEWDTKLEAVYKPECIITPNQVEPDDSIFYSFRKLDLGKTPQEFRYEEWLKAEQSFSTDKINDIFTIDGQTWPIFMSKKWYMVVGGIDPAFPSPAVADWDFFFRCELMGMCFRRYNGLHFYHFGSAATKKSDVVNSHKTGEQQSFEYFAWKWGFVPTLDKCHNKRPVFGKVRGFII